MNKLIIAAFRGGILSAVRKDDRIVQLNYEREKSSLVGNIYAARVQHIQKNLEAAFLDIGEELPAYYAYGRGSAPVRLGGDTRRELREGDEILVKIKKDAHKTKGPTAVADFRERGESELLKKALFSKAPACVRRGEPFWLRSASRADEILTDLPAVYETLTGEAAPEEKSYEKCLPEICRAERTPVRALRGGAPVRLHSDRQIGIAALCSLETAVSEALSRKVWLKSGGFLVIDPVEAMTVVDVNSGKTTRWKERRQLLRRTDLEAAEETMRQLRLRNLSGIILVDFIDLKAEEDREELMDQLRALAGRDPVKTEIVDITRLNLVEITRKKSERSFAEQMREAEPV